jgi:hypothetical protein
MLELLEQESDVLDSNAGLHFFDDLADYNEASSDELKTLESVTTV